MKDIFVLVVKKFEVVCTSNLETAHNLMSLGWICSPLTQNRVKGHITHLYNCRNLKPQDWLMSQWWNRGLNPGPFCYEPDALTARAITTTFNYKRFYTRSSVGMSHRAYLCNDTNVLPFPCISA